MKSLAASPLIPLATGLGAAALIFGTLSNGNTGGEDPNAALAGSEAPAEDPMAAAPETPVEEPAPAAPATGNLTAGKAATVGGLKLTATAVTAKGATVTVGKKSYTLTTKKASKIGKYTVTVTKVTPAKKSAAVTVAGG